MDYIDDIKQLISALLNSPKFHILCISGPPGWGKTHTVQSSLDTRQTNYQLLGSYSTPLALYNHLSEHPDDVLVLDDCAGIFYNPNALSILNAATWNTATGSKKRLVKWNSTSGAALKEETQFNGKIIALTNFLPDTPPARAFKSRSYFYSIEAHPKLIRQRLSEAASDTKFFEDTELSKKVASFLSDLCLKNDRENRNSSISLRSLEMGVELARIDPQNWKNLLVKVLDAGPAPQPDSQPKDDDILFHLAASGLKVEEQFAEFSKLTGKSRRTFFNLRNKLKIQKP